MVGFGVRRMARRGRRDGRIRDPLGTTPEAAGGGVLAGKAAPTQEQANNFNSRRTMSPRPSEIVLPVIILLSAVTVMAWGLWMWFKL